MTAWRPAVDAAVQAAAKMTGRTVRQIMSKATDRNMPPARIAAMLALRQAGMPNRAIAAAFGVHEASASNACERARQRLSNAAFRALVKAAGNAAGALVPAETPPARAQTGWTPEEEETLLSLRAEGATFAAITQALPGRSRGMIAGKMARLARPSAPRKAPASAWTAEEEGRLAEMRTAGAGWDEIAAALGRGAATVRNRASELRKRGVTIDRLKRDTSWKPWEDEILRKGRAAGESFAGLERALPGRTKNMLVGRAHRLGLPAPKTHKPAPKPRPRRRVDAGSCQWIEGDVPDCLDDGGNAPFCGEPVREGSSYCPAHHARCYRGPAANYGEEAA